MLLVARRSQGQVTARIQWPVNGFPFSLSSFLPLLFLLHRPLEDFSGLGCPQRKKLVWWNHFQHTSSSVAAAHWRGRALCCSWHRECCLYFKAVQHKTLQGEPGWASAVNWDSAALAEGAGAAAVATEVQSVCREPGWHVRDQRVYGILNRSCLVMPGFDHSHG